jgi:type VI secretion system protein
MAQKTLHATVVAVCLMLSACVAPRTGVSLRVAVAPDANDRTPVPVDVVFVWDNELLEKVGALTAADWFAAKPQFRQDDPLHRALTVCEWEWVPGQAVPDIDLTVPVAARRWIRGVFLFTNYRAAGAHRLTVTPGTVAQIELRRDDTVLRTLGKTPAAADGALVDACEAPSSQARTSS